MDIRNATNPKDAKKYDTKRLRDEYLIEGLFEKDEIKLVYSHVDRMVTGSCCPINPVSMVSGEILHTQYFLDRREIGIINIGGSGSITVDGVDYNLENKDGIYIGMGVKDIIFKSADINMPAKYYFNSTPAHKHYPIEKIDIKKAEPAKMGSLNDSNERTIYKYIHPEGVRSCQLVMGLTILESGSVWNTMPCHTHDRRMEVYMYFDIGEDSLVYHFMGEPEETRHIVVRNEQAIISPSWSIHSGCGTRNYKFIWGMAGENQTFADMDWVSMNNMK